MHSAVWQNNPPDLKFFLFSYLTFPAVLSTDYVFLLDYLVFFQLSSLSLSSSEARAGLPPRQSPLWPFWTMATADGSIIWREDAGCLVCPSPSPHRAVEVGQVWSNALIPMLPFPRGWYSKCKVNLDLGTARSKSIWMSVLCASCWDIEQRCTNQCLWCAVCADRYARIPLAE